MPDIISKIFKLLFSLVLFAVIAGGFISAHEGYVPPELTAHTGIVKALDCNRGKYNYAWLKLEDSKSKFYPDFRYFSYSCEKFLAKVKKGVEVDFQSTHRNRLWSLSVNSEVIYIYGEHESNIRKEAPYHFLITTLMCFSILVYFLAKKGIIKKFHDKESL